MHGIHKNYGSNKHTNNESDSGKIKLKLNDENQIITNFNLIFISSYFHFIFSVEMQVWLKQGFFWQKIGEV
jgi:hypothetical protein